MGTVFGVLLSKKVYLCFLFYSYARVIEELYDIIVLPSKGPTLFLIALLTRQLNPKSRYFTYRNQQCPDLKQ